MVGRSKVAGRLIEFFVDQGKILGVRELDAHPDAPLRSKHVKRAWGTYRRFLNVLKKRYPEEWELIHSEELEVEVEVEEDENEEVSE